jgi:hypothetical protein
MTLRGYRRPTVWWPWLLLLAGLAAASWLWAVREVKGMEQTLRASGETTTVITRRCDCDLSEFEADIDRRFAVVRRVIMAIEARRGTQAPRMLDEVGR